jgi:hypothetical protein
VGRLGGPPLSCAPVNRAIDDQGRSLYADHATLARINNTGTPFGERRRGPLVSHRRGFVPGRFLLRLSGPTRPLSDNGRQPARERHIEVAGIAMQHGTAAGQQGRRD